uniref:NAC domain-containing protein n=1 Tax=Hordeum vulgare subsp. vulgare TaxID=112509 RepID=A0A8I6Z9A6_HORVV
MEEELVPQLRFPAGYHFRPTDEELLDVYLRAKIDGREPPLDVFMDVNILDWDPDELVEKRKAYGEGRYFFFTKRTEFPANKNLEPRRKLNNVKASWKATGRPGIIKHTKTRETIGTRRILTYETKGGHRDRWSMNEFILKGREGLDQWVLCTIQEKQNWAKSIKRAAGKMEEHTSSAGKMAARGTRKGRNTKRHKMEKTDPSQPHKTQQQQETTPDVSSQPPPLLTSRHHALHEEIMALDGTTPMIQVVVQQEHPYGDQHYLDAPAPQETACGAPGELPLNPQHQQGYLQAGLEEQQHLKFENPFPVHHQLDPFNTMIFQDHTDQEPMLGWWQQHLGYTDHSLFFPLAGGMEHASECQLSHQQTLDPFGTPSFHGDFIPTPDHELQFQPDPEKASEQQTSPDSVLCACQHGQLKQHGAVKVTCFLCGGGGF